MTKGIYNKFWSVEDVAILKFLYPEMTNFNIAKILGKTEMSIIHKAWVLRLVKDKEFINRCAAKTMFKKGNVSFNKGLKQSDFMSPDAIKRTAATRFKKGDLPHNAYDKDGIINVRRDNKTGIDYLYIRVKLGVWVLYQRYQYEKFIGEIPVGFIVALKDGNSGNCHPFNLELLSKRENMLRNTIQRYPDELIKSMKMLGKLKRKIIKYGTE